MDGERTARIWRTLHKLRAQVEASLSYRQRLPVAMNFHRTLSDVISDFEPIAITIPANTQSPTIQAPDGETTSI